MRYFFYTLLIVAVSACKKNTPVDAVLPPVTDTTPTNDTVPVPCGCLDAVAYNYDSSFGCNDTSQCYYATNKLSGTYAGDNYDVVFDPSVGLTQDVHHPDTVVISKVSSNRATYQSTVGNPFTFYVTNTNPNDIQFHYMSDLYTGHLIADTALSWSYSTTDFNTGITTNAGFHGTRVQ